MTEIEPAFSHMVQELGFDKVKVSLEAEFDLLEKAHDAIHEYLLLAPLVFSFRDAQKSDWDRKSAFLFVYHSEVFEQAHRSLMEALCAYYNAAFILLRTTLELLLKGAFWECFSHLTSGTSEVFDRGVLVEVLHEYAKLLHRIMDIAIVVELNVIGDFIRKHKEVGEQIMVRLPELERLGLEYGLVRTRDLLDVAA